MEVDGADYAGESGLDGIEEYGVGEAFGRAGGAIAGSSYAFLEDSPR